MDNPQPEKIPYSNPDSKHHDFFGAIAAGTIRVAGSKWAFLVALLSVVVWGAFGPYLRYSDHWQIVINTGTTVVTFLMVFLIQNAQNRESKAVHLKLDELIYSMNRASNALIHAESLSEEELDRLGNRYQRLAAECQAGLRKQISAVGQDLQAIEQQVEGVHERVTKVEKKAEKNLSR
jgi:low affinity Fe/Cu permease